MLPCIKMKNNIYLIFILFLLFGCNSNSQVLEYWPNGNNKTEIIVKKGSVKNPQEYVIIAYYNNGEIFKTGEVVNSKEQGTWQYYFADGSLKSKNTYKNGSLDGPFKLFYRNGDLKQEGTYANNQIEKATHYDIYGNQRENIPNIIQPTLEIEPWTLEQIDLMIIECVATQDVNYSNTNNFCDCMIKSLAVQYPFELYSNLSQGETNLAYENLLKDNYCNGIRKEKNAR